ncbi:MAG: 4-hydroxy-tetrahydrodipicolinate synthase [Lachnospiraceae bacterium]|nr:4-hydroxy-tetrahydrodipicolinate synthase [Lachnospiraceae bacterium]
MSIFKGSGVAIVTPMNADGSVNYEKLTELVNYQIEHKTDAIIICGTTGESATLSEEEHKKCVETAVKAVAGRVPVIAGSGSNNAAHAVELSKNAEAAGADALLVVTPYYNKATQKGLYEYYKLIAENTKLPIIMYNVPSRTGTNIKPATAMKIAKEIKNVVGIKEACGNLSQIAELASLNDGSLDIISGNDDQTVPILSIGGVGVISVLANVAPENTHDIVMEYLNGNIEKARKLQLEAIELINALFVEVNPMPVKKAMNLMGMNVGPLRLPMCEMEENNVKVLEKALRNYGLIK